WLHVYRVGYQETSDDLFFFFQEEDGIRDSSVTGVQTCALPILLMDVQMPGMSGLEATRRMRAHERERGRARTPIVALTASAMARSEERRVGKECRAPRWAWQ